MANPTLLNYKNALIARGYALDATTFLEVINGARREVIAAKRWPFLDKNSTSLTVTAGSTSVALSGIADLLHVDAVRIDSATEPYELDWLPNQELERESNLDRTNDVPDFWSRRGGSLLLHPRPNKTYTLSIDYTPDVTDLAADGDVCVIPRLYMDAVVWGAQAEMASRQRDYATADRAEKKRDDAVLRMSRAFGLAQRQGGRRVQETGVWDDQA